MVEIKSNAPETAKVWVYQSDRLLSPQDKNVISQKLDAFINTWNTHGTKLASTYEILLDTFIVFIVDESQQGASGCSIDSSVKVMKELGSDLQIDFFNRLNIAIVHSNNTTEILPYQDVVNNWDGLKDFHTTNNTINTLSELKNNWIIPLKQSWVANRAGVNI